MPSMTEVIMIKATYGEKFNQCSAVQEILVLTLNGSWSFSGLIQSIGARKVQQYPKIFFEPTLDQPKMMTKMKKQTKSAVTTLADKGRVFAIFTNLGPIRAPSTIRTACPPQNI